MANKVEYVKKYQEGRDAIMLRPTKEDGQIVRSYAKAKGTSVQGLVMKIVLEYIESHPVSAEYRYGMRLRGYSPRSATEGCSAERRRSDRNISRHHRI